MKKFRQIVIAVVCLACLATVMTGCGGTGAGDLGLLNDGILKVGMEIGYPPFEFFSDDGSTPIGLDVDLANAIGEIMGVKVEFQNTDFTGILDGLKTDRYDCVISALTITGDRIQEVDFTQKYIENWQCIVVKKGNPAVTSVEGLNGLNVGFQEGTTSRDYIDELMDSGVVDCTTHPYEKILSAFDDLKLGRLEAVLVDSTVADGYLAREPEMYEMTWSQSTEPGAEAETFGIAVKKGNQKLLDALNDAMKQLEENGKLDEFRSDWLS